MIRRRRLPQRAAAVALLSAAATIPLFVPTSAPALPDDGDRPVGPSTPDGAAAESGLPSDAATSTTSTTDGAGTPGTSGSRGTLEAGIENRGSDGVPNSASLGLCRYAVEDADCANYCANAQTLCLDPQGQPVCSPPSTVSEGATLTIRVIGGSGCDTDTFTIETATQKSPDHLTAGRMPQAAPAGGRVLRELSVVASTDVATSAILVSFTHANASSSSSVSTSTTIAIDHGHYYVGVGVLLALSPRGTRVVAHDAVPGTTDTRLSVREDWDIRPALALEVFPLGRDRGRICSFCLPEKTPFWHGVWRITRNVIGLHLGTELDFGAAKQHHYLGAALELIGGFGFDIGAAWIQGEFLPAGYTQGMLVAPSFQPDVAYMVRPYFGFTLSQDILDTISAFGRAAKGTQLQ